MTSADALDELSRSLGPVGVRTDPDEVRGHVTPWRGPVGDAAAVVRPADVDEVRTVVAWARRHRIRLVPQGANTGLVGASTPPARSDAVVLSLRRLRDGPVIDPVDRTAVVGAGTLLSELNAAAAPHGLCLPVDLGADPTLGGMVATNTGGARMLRHGDLRRSLLGLRAVLADERCSVVDELTTLRKHNVGPSVGRLLVGAGGAFGVITDVAVELHPVSPDRACAWLAPASDRAVVEVLTRLERSCAGELSAFEVVSDVALDAACALRPTGGPVDAHPFGTRPTPPHSVLVELEGPGGCEDRLVAALDAVSVDGLLDDAVVLPADDAWAIRHAVSSGLSQLGDVVGIDVSVARSRLPELVAAVRDVVASRWPGTLVADFGHWGDGGVHCNLVFPRDGSPSVETRTAARELVIGLVVERFGGSFSAEHGIGPVNAGWWRRTTSDGTRLALRELAAATDPLDVLGHPDLPFRDD